MFTKSDIVHPAMPDVIEVPEYIASAVPDAGEALLVWFDDLLDQTTAARLTATIDAYRGPNGWIAGNSLKDVPTLGRKQTPLTYLALMTGSFDRIALSVWATSARRGKEYKDLGRAVEDLIATQGHAAAATWAVVNRPSAHLDVDLLARLLREAWEKVLGSQRNGDVIRAFRNWNRRT